MTTHAPTTPGTIAPGASFTYSEAGELTGLHPDTIKRERERGKFPGACQEVTGRKSWRIPVEDLVAAGHLPADRVGERLAELEKLRETEKVLALREKIADRDAVIARLQAELDAARREALRLDAARADSDANLKLALKLAAKAA